MKRFADKVFKALPGEWRFKRIVTGYMPETVLMNGQISFAPFGGNKLLYTESAVMGAGQAEVSREYIYELRKGSLFILYHDPHRKNEIMHELEFNDENGLLEACHCHHCSPDQYDLTLRFNAEGVVTMFYKIIGPKKNYTIETSLVKQPS